MTRRDVLRQMSLVSFERKIRFSASQDLAITRSDCFKPSETEKQIDTRSIKPPDFTMKLYSRLNAPPKKQSSTNSNVAVPQSDATKKTKGGFFPNIMHVAAKRKDAPKFITAHKPPDALRSEVMFVKRGKYPQGPYKNPKPHNFRPLNEDLPDMITTYKRDPGSLNSKLQHVDMLRSNISNVVFSCRDTKTRMDTFKPAEPTWHPELILPSLPWPPKSASYTRHQRRRGAYSAFLDRVEEKLSQSWKNKS